MPLILGAAIIQDRNGILTPIAYFSKKLDKAQRNYTTTEKELLAIIMVLRAYCKMLSGARIIIYADHNKLTFPTFSVQRVLQWRLYIDKFDTILTYIQGKKNVLADYFLRLPLMENPIAGDKELQGT